MLEETVRCWTVRATCMGDQGTLQIRDNRTGKTTPVCRLIHFPAGWRSGDIERLNVPEYVKAAARRVMNRLP